jgi:hypothetical protein
MMSIVLLGLICLVFLAFAGLGILFWVLSRQKAEDSTPALPPQPQKITSPDGNLEARIQKRPDGNFQVETYRWEQEDIPGMGVVETWRLVSGPSILPSLAEAVEFAGKQVKAGSSDFFDD